MAEETMDGPLDHIVRLMPPWHTGPDLTECGRPVADVKSLVTRDEVMAKVKRLGKARAAFSTCMTCAQTSDRYRHDEGRMTSVERWAQGAWREKYNPTANGNRQNRELLAVGMLLDEHREEFLELIEALEQTTDLSSARRRARMRSVK